MYLFGLLEVAGYVHHQTAVRQRRTVGYNSIGKLALTIAECVRKSQTQTRPHGLGRLYRHAAIAHSDTVFLGLKFGGRSPELYGIEVDHARPFAESHVLERRHHIVDSGGTAGNLLVAGIDGIAVGHVVAFTLGITAAACCDIGLFEPHRKHRTVGHHRMEAFGGIADGVERPLGKQFEHQGIGAGGIGKTRAADSVISRHYLYQRICRVGELHAPGKLVESDAVHTAQIACETHRLAVVAPGGIGFEVLHIPSEHKRGFSGRCVIITTRINNKQK